MAIAATHILTNQNSGGQSSYATASGSPTAGSLELFLVGSQVASGTVGIPTVTGAGFTWVQVATQISDDNLRRATVFRAMGTASAGALTIDFAGVTQVRCGWSWSEFSGTDTSGTNGSGAIVQSASGQVDNLAAQTGITVTLAAFGSVNNATYGAIRYGASSTSDAFTAGSNFIQLGLVNGSASYQSQYALSNQTSVNWTWNSSNTFTQAIAVEIKAFVPPPSTSGQSGSTGLNNLNNLSMLNLNRIL